MHTHASFGAFAVVIVLALLLAAVLSPAVRKLAGRITGSLITGAAAAGIAVAVLDHNWHAAITAHHLGPDLGYVWGVTGLAVAAVMFRALTARANSPAIRALRDDDDYWRRAPARRSPGRRSRAGAGR
jgi:hypothetical protein